VSAHLTRTARTARTTRPGTAAPTTPGEPGRATRATRRGLLAATALTVAALTLTACNDGSGTRDEGASAASTTGASSTGSASSASGAHQAPASGKGADSGSKGSGGGSKGSSAGSAGSAGSTGSTGSAGSSGTRNAPCDGGNSRTTATVVSRPVNHLLLTVTNTGKKSCDLAGYPMLRFTGAQAVPPAFDDSKPQAVVTLFPGESGYAGVRLSAADGSGGHGYTAKTLTVYFSDGRPNSDDLPAATPDLPAKGVFIDDSLTTTWWQQEMDDALAY
jgi:Protein of unknown function (DUF4232)